MERKARLAACTVIFAFLLANHGTTGQELISGAPGKLRVTPLHYTVNLRKQYTAAAALGFNLADVSSPLALNSLPPSMKGVYWMGNGYKRECRWRISDAEAREIIVAIRDHPNFSGVYRIADTPHPSVCPDAAAALARRTALVHSLDPDGKTFVVVVNGFNYPDEFRDLAHSADYIGVDPYPCNLKNVDTGCDLKKIRSRFQSAIDAGIEINRIVPVFQAFGQQCVQDNKAYYRLPSIAETEAMLALWDELVPVDQRPFDMTYSWGPQRRHSCPSLVMADGQDYPNLQQVFSRYFANTFR
jgi:hypothetical protein